MSSYPEDDHHYSGCFGRARRNTPSGSTHRGFFGFGQGGRTVLPPLSSAFRSSRSTVPDHSSSHTHQDLDGRNEYNAPSNDPTTWPGYNTIGQQSSFAAYDNDPRQHQYSPQQIPYSSYPSRDQVSSYPINPTDSRILPPINVSHDRWSQGAYASSVARPSENIYSPVATYPPPSYPQFSSHQPPPSHHAIPPPDPRGLPPSVPMGSTAQASGIHRRTNLSVDRNSTVRNSTHATSPYARHPPQSDITPEPPQVKKKRKRADAEQLKVLNEVYARTAFPSTEERQELATRLNMTPRSVQIWFQNKRQSMRNTHRQSGSLRGTGTDSPSTTSSHPPPVAQSASRSSQNPGNILSIPTAPSRPGSIVSHTQPTYISPSPTDTSYYGAGRPVQMHQGQTSTSHHRPPSRSRDSYGDYYEGSRRSRG